jgi:hypothetical protein
MSDRKEIVRTSPSVLTLLLILFIALKLCGVISWSWWWVLAPLWMLPAVVLGICSVIGIIAFICWLARRNQ